MEAMQLQKNQLLDLNRELAEKRGRERDRHRIYMQVKLYAAGLCVTESKAGLTNSHKL